MDGDSTLHFAVSLGNDRIARTLLERGSTGLHNSTNGVWWTPLHTAAGIGNTAAARLLGKAGCQMNSTRFSGMDSADFGTRLRGA
ncbi:hypothetical protein F5B18DRAFT_596215 [Nemania serpens]|nr:hypothetical protein F5B18DRAFT_596215 [Nemania serpens]